MKLLNFYYKIIKALKNNKEKIQFLKLYFFFIINIYILWKIIYILQYTPIININQYNINNDWLNWSIELINLIYNTNNINDLQLKITIIYILLLFLGLYIINKNIYIFFLYLLYINKQIQKLYIKIIINKENVEILGIKFKYTYSIDEKINIFFSNIKIKMTDWEVTYIKDTLNLLTNKKEILQFLEIYLKSERIKGFECNLGYIFNTEYYLDINILDSVILASGILVASLVFNYTKYLYYYTKDIWTYYTNRSINAQTELNNLNNIYDLVRYYKATSWDVIYNLNIIKNLFNNKFRNLNNSIQYLEDIFIFI